MILTVWQVFVLHLDPSGGLWCGSVEHKQCTVIDQLPHPADPGTLLTLQMSQKYLCSKYISLKEGISTNAKPDNHKSCRSDESCVCVRQPVFLPAGRSRALVYVKCTLATTTDQNKTTTKYFFVYYLGWGRMGLTLGTGVCTALRIVQWPSTF